MEKKQSSIDWLEQQFNTIREQGNIEVENLIWQQAKAMHKEEVQDAWLNGMKGEMIAPFAMNRYKPEAQEYYNETYGEKFGEKFGGQDEK